MKAYYRKDGDQADTVYLIDFYADGEIKAITGPHKVFSLQQHLPGNDVRLPVFHEGMFVGPIDTTTGNTVAYEESKKGIEVGDSITAIPYRRNEGGGVEGVGVWYSTYLLQYFVSKDGQIVHITNDRRDAFKVSEKV